MIRQHTLRLWLLLCTMTAALILSGCGGGSSGGGTTTDDTATITGTAAAGAPVSGFVGARDASGATLNTNIEPDGSFELDLATLDTPVLLYASGIAGGKAYQLLSVVLDDDVNGTVNITPVTDLIVGNADGRTPQSIFNNPDFTQLTQERVEAAEENLKTRLKPLLDSLGVEDDFDLRNTAFAANRSGFDAVLDIIEVTVDEGGGIATIRSRLDPNVAIQNTFQQPEEEPIAETPNLEDGVATLQALGTLATSFADALEAQNETALGDLVTGEFLNNGETITGLATRLSGSAAGIEDAGELADDIRNWSLAELGEGTAKLNVGAAQGPWNAINDNGDWKLQGNQLEFFVFVEPTHQYQNGAENPVVEGIGTLIYAGFPSARLGAVADSSVTVSGDLASFNGNLPIDAQNNRFADFQGLPAGSISSGDQVTFAWNNPVEGVIDSVATFTIRRGSPDLSNGLPEITAASADLTTDGYSFQWTLPPGYDAVSVRNNFTGQTSGGEGGGFTGNPLANNATSFNGTLPETYVPATDDELRLIARDPFGVFVSARMDNPFADQVPPPMAEAALIGSWIARNTDRGDNAPWVQLTFLESGYYMHQELDLPYRPAEDTSGNTGIEFGQYQWDNQTGELTVTSISTDDNGEWGLTSTFAGDERLSLQVEGNTLTAYNPTIGLSESTEFTRAPLNESGITGSWVYQNSVDPSDFVVATLLEDGFYFVGSTTPAEPEFGSEVGLEFGTYTYNSATLVLDATPIFDQNGTAGLSDPLPQSFYYSTVVDGSLIFDEGENAVAQLSELAPGVVPSNGDVTVDYVSPGDQTASPAVVGDFHYLRNVIGIEGSREFTAPTVFQGVFSYTDTVIADNGDGTGTLSWSGICLADLLVDANTAPTTGDAVFDAASECLPSSGGTIDNVAYTDSGLSANLPAETIIDPEDQSQIQLGSASLTMTAVDANRSLFIGQSVRDFGYEEPNSFTDGIEISAHVLTKKSTGRTVADLEGNWGFVARSLYDIDGPNDLGYESSTQIMNVDNAGVLTRVNRLDRRIVQVLTADTFSPISVSIDPEDTIPEEVGSITISDNGTVDLLGGFGGGILSAGGNVIFGNFTNPITPLATPESDSQWFALVRLSDTFSQADLEGKEYEVIAQSFWIQPEFFEVDYLEPGASLTFPAAGGQASLTRAITFPYVPFVDNAPLQREGDPLSTAGLDYTVSPNGRITLTTDFGQTETSFEINGFATPDARLLVFETTLTTTSGSGTSEGGIGMAYAICTNCD